MPVLYNRKTDIYPEDAVYIGRPSKWGNPFKARSQNDRDDVIDKYEEMLRSSPDLVFDIMNELKGKDLVCHCAPKRCHGDIILAIANLDVPGYRTIVAGSRSCGDYDIVASAINNCGWDISCIISGSAKGVDTIGEEYARANLIRVERFPAQWDTHGRKAGFIRNIQMAENAEALIAVWDGISSGTQHMIEYAKNKGLKVYIHHVF